MKRWILNILLASSLLLCLATLVLWVCSHRFAIYMVCRTGGTRYELDAYDGKLNVSRMHPWNRPPLVVYGWDPINEPTPPKVNTNWDPLGLGWREDQYREALGFMWATGIYSPPFSWQMPKTPFQRIAIPSWSAFAVTAVGPAIWIRNRRRSRRTKDDGIYCTNCGYDLRASNDRCPECGEPIPPIRVKTTT